MKADHEARVRSWCFSPPPPRLSDNALLLSWLVGLALRVFVGYDMREAVGAHAFVQSLWDTSKDYALMPPLSGLQAGGASNAFTLERFRVPELCGWSGVALSVDGCDMLLRADVSGLAGLFDSTKAVQVVKHEYSTRHALKYVGTEMEAPNYSYPRKNWSSVVLWNCGHIAHFEARDEIRDALERADGAYLHRFGWLDDGLIGELPREWNWLCDEFGDNPQAKLLHWTAGIPGFQHYRQTPHAGEWLEALRRAQRGLA